DAYRAQYGLRSAYVLPVNLYGPHDNFDLESSHVIPALIRKCVEARQRRDKQIVCWGTGSASREFLYVEDAAEGVVRAAEVMDEPTPINRAPASEKKTRALVELIVSLPASRANTAGDTTNPEAHPRRCLDTSRAAKLLNWRAQTGFEDGLTQT